MTANDRETPGLTASCPELGHELGHGGFLDAVRSRHILERGS